MTSMCECRIPDSEEDWVVVDYHATAPNAVTGKRRKAKTSRIGCVVCGFEWTSGAAYVETLTRLPGAE